MMADSKDKKRVITINGPIASGKQKLAKLFALFYKNPKIVKMPKAKILEYYTLAKANDSEGYEEYIENECGRITYMLTDYFEADNENDALIIITDVTALIRVLSKEEKAPKISDDFHHHLDDLERSYWRLLKDNALHTYVCTETDHRNSLLDIHFNKEEEIPRDFSTADRMKKQNESYNALMRTLILEHGFISETGEDVQDKDSDKQSFTGDEFSFHAYKL